MGALLIMALMLGIGGSFHCLAMCGPLVMRLPFSQGKRSIPQTLLYHLGKSTAYGILGILFGYLGKAFILFNWQQALSIVAGVVMLALTFLPQINKSLSGKFIFSRQMTTVLQQLLQGAKNRHFMALGFLNGFLPCGLVYTALAGATVTANPWFGFLFMFVFGMGTVPSLSLIAFFNQSMQDSWRTKLRTLSVVFSLVVGLLLIVRGLNLNIPFLSPYMDMHGNAIDCH